MIFTRLFKRAPAQSTQPDYPPLPVSIWLSAIPDDSGDVSIHFQGEAARPLFAGRVAEIRGTQSPLLALKVVPHSIYTDSIGTLHFPCMREEE